jgi:hypothetical protein
MSIGKAEKTPEGYSIEIIVDSRPDGPAPHAAAFEYGSGEHGEKGETYIIEPRAAGKKLEIPRSRWPNYVESEADMMAGVVRDPIYLPYVNHPGVEAKPYLQPAIESNRSIIREALGKIFKSAYLDSTVKVTVISAKK